MKKYYKDKGIGKIKELKEIRKELKENISSSNEFNKYKDNEDKYLFDYYDEVTEQEYDEQIDSIEVDFN